MLLNVTRDRVRLLLHERDLERPVLEQLPVAFREKVFGWRDSSGVVINKPQFLAPRIRNSRKNQPRFTFREATRRGCGHGIFSRGERTNFFFFPLRFGLRSELRCHAASPGAVEHRHPFIGALVGRGR